MANCKATVMFWLTKQFSVTVLTIDQRALSTVDNGVTSAHPHSLSQSYQVNFAVSCEYITRKDPDWKIFQTNEVSYSAVINIIKNSFLTNYLKAEFEIKVWQCTQKVMIGKDCFILYVSEHNSSNMDRKH